MVWQLTFFAQSLNEAGISFSDIDSFTATNETAMKEGKLTYLSGKYSSSIGPVFALVMNAIDGNVIRDEDGNAPSISQKYLVATDVETFDKYYVSDNVIHQFMTKKRWIISLEKM